MDLLGRARKMLKGTGPGASARPQYYSVTCAQSHSLRGLRTEGYQALRCPTCGEGIFVLPRSPLPEPSAPPARARPARISVMRSDPLEDGPVPLSDPPAQEADEVIWLDDAPPNATRPANGPGSAEPPVYDDDIPIEYLPVSEEDTDEEEYTDEAEYELEEVSETESESEPEPPDFSLEPVTEEEEEDEVEEPPRRPRRRRRPEPEEAEARPGLDVRPGERREVSVLEKREGLREWARRRKMPLVLVSVMLLVVSTFAVRLWRHRRENLPHEAEVNYVQGTEALENGEFDSAKRKLAVAASDFKSLGIRDGRGRQSRQLANEAAILADRATRTLEEIIEEAARYDPPEKWPSRFETIYRGQAVIIDSEVAAVPAHSASGSYELTHRIFVGRSPGRRGRIDLKGFKLFEALKPVKSQRVTFGARLESLTLDGNEWVLGLEPDSGVIMTNQDALEKADWTPLAEEPSRAERGGRR